MGVSHHTPLNAAVPSHTSPTPATNQIACVAEACSTRSFLIGLVPASLVCSSQLQGRIGSTVADLHCRPCPWSLSCVASCAPPCPRSSSESKMHLSGPQLSVTIASEDTPLLARQKPRPLTNLIRNPGCLPCQHTLPFAPTASLPQIHHKWTRSSLYPDLPSCSCLSAYYTPKRPRGPRLLCLYIWPTSLVLLLTG